jgi:poly(hydroxyalkanoate) depolymerase family esterase
MVKTTSNPWLRSLLRAGKKQQRSVVRALGKLLTPPKPKAKPKLKSAATTTRKPRVAAPTTIAPLKLRSVRPAPPASPRAIRSTAASAAAPASETEAPASGKWLASHYSGFSDHGVIRRMSYWLYLPDRPSAETAAGPGLPLIVMLHGCDQSATLFAQGTRMNQLAETAGYAVLYPQQSVGTHPRRCWKWYDRATQHGGGEVPMIVGIINKVSEKYPIDRSRVFICGISAGAAMANIVALNHPELFAGMGLHSGPTFGVGHSTIGALAVMQHGGGARVDGAIAEVLDKRPGFPSLPTILIQGEDDPVVRPINQTQLAHQAMLVNQLPADSPAQVVLKAGNKRGHAYQLRDVYRGRKVMLRVARIAELKHAWSGGDGRLSFNSGHGPDASKMMLDFFSRQRRTV